MTTEEHLNRIVAKCRELLAIAEKRTPGKWQAGGVCDLEVRQPRGRMIADCGPHHTPLNEYPVGCANQDRANAAFIASCAGPAEAGWCATIAAIEMADKLDSVHEARDIRAVIIAAWPEELL